MNKKLLHQSAKNIILNVNYAEMQDMLNDYQDFLTQDENQTPLEDNTKSISISFTTIISILIIVILLIPIMISFMIVETSMNTPTQLMTQLVIGAIIPIIAYLIFNKKVSLLSKFYEPSKNEKAKAMLLCLVPIIIVTFNTVLKLIFVKYDWYHVFNFYALSDNISKALIFALIVYSLNKFLKTSNIYFSFFNISYISMVVIAQVTAMNSTMTSVEQYYAFYNYVFALLVIGAISSIILLPKNKNKEK